MNTIKLHELGKYGAGLNIEGGYPCNDLLKVNPSGRWVNVIVALDRPLIDNMLFDDVIATVTSNAYPLLENAIRSLNEHHVLARFLSITLYYIRLLSDKPSQILIWFHQDVIAHNLIKIFDTMLNHLLNVTNMPLRQNVLINYATDTPIYTKTHNVSTSTTDVVLSFSQCAGLVEAHAPGTLLVATEFIPFVVSKNTVRKSDAYRVENDLVLHLEAICQAPYNNLICQYVNQTYVSSAQTKQADQTNAITVLDFVSCSILQVDDLWNPTDPEQVINII